MSDDGDAHWEVAAERSHGDAARVAAAAVRRPRDRPREPVSAALSPRERGAAAAGVTLARVVTLRIPAARPWTCPRTLICGSLAYDTIMVFPDRFARHILPEQTACAVGIVPDRRDAARMGRMRGQHRLQPAGTGRRAGRDGDARRRRRAPIASGSTTLRHRAATACARCPGTFTAQAFIITDLDDNQITAFHPGRDEFVARRIVSATSTNIGARHRRAGRPRGHALARRAVRGREAFRSSSIPGQGLPLFSGPELLEMIDAATFLAVNDYEGAACSPSARAFRSRTLARTRRRGRS